MRGELIAAVLSKVPFKMLARVNQFHRVRLRESKKRRGLSVSECVKEPPIHQQVRNGAALLVTTFLHHECRSGHVDKKNAKEIRLVWKWGEPRPKKFRLID